MGILFFNWYGYQLLTDYWQQQADKGLEARLDRNEYDDTQLYSIRIPLTNLSYYNNYSSFQRVDGQIDIDGIRYKYVKRRIYKDSLELYCIPNETAIQLQHAKNDFFRQVNDLQQHNHGKRSRSQTKPISKVYEPSAMQIAVQATASPAPAKTVYTLPYCQKYYSPTDEMPPDQTTLLS